jgi:hypothetical protein
MNERAMLREVEEVLRDYRERLNRIGPEAFRLRGETHAAWEAQRRRLDDLLERLSLDGVLRELARAPEAPIPPGGRGRRP